MAEIYIKSKVSFKRSDYLLLRNVYLTILIMVSTTLGLVAILNSTVDDSASAVDSVQMPKCRIVYQDRGF